ncbi:MAG: Ig-like domain-containing protein [Gemmatimonadales bacterium]
MQSTSPTAPGRWRSRTLATTVAATALLLGACIEDFSAPDAEGPVDNVLVSTIPLNESMVELFIGNTRQLLAGPRNADGQFVPGQSVVWSSSNEGVVSVSSTGLATAVSSGTAVISATAGGVTGTTEIKVRFPVGQVVVSPASGTIRREGAIQLTAAITDQGGTARTNRTVTWASLNPTVATVSASGLVSGLTDGQAVITATSEGVTGQATITVFGSPVIATVTVTPASPLRGTGQTLQMTATARAGSGTIISDATYTWSSGTPSVATVSPTGLVTFVGPGTAVISATAPEITGPKTGSTTATVLQSLANGVSFTVPDLGDNVVYFAMVTVPAGLASFSVTMSGPGPSGPGDGDIYLYDPLTALPTGFGGGGTTTPTFRCRPWLYGTNETCTVNAPAAGSYIVAVHNYPGTGGLTGAALLLTHP